MGLTVGYMLIIAVQITSLAYLFIDGTEVAEVISVSLSSTFAAYLLTLSLIFIGQTDVDKHWKSLCHLWSLTTLATAFYGVRWILPTEEDPIPSIMGTSGPTTIDKIFLYATFILYIFQWIITSSIPRTAAVHFPPERIYNAKTLASNAPLAFANVCGIVQASIASILLFSYTTPVVMLGYTSESLEIRDLPIVPADMRATPIYTIMRATYRNIKTPAWVRPKPGTGRDLLYKLFKNNKAGFGLQVALAAVSAVLFYLPALFLQRLVAFLEVLDKSDGKMDKSWG